MRNKAIVLFLMAIWMSGAVRVSTRVPTLTPIPLPAGVVMPIMKVDPYYLHYGETLNVEVIAPKAVKVLLTANIEDPFYIPMPYDGQSRSFKIGYSIPMEGLDVEEGDYIFKAIVYYENGSKIKVKEKVCFVNNKKKPELTGTETK